MNKENNMNINNKQKEIKKLVNLNHSGVEGLEEIGSIFTLLEKKGTTFVEGMRRSLKFLGVVGEDIYIDCESRILYGFMESMNNIDKEYKFEEFRKGLTEIFRDMLDKLENYDMKVDQYSALTLISEFSLDIFIRILRYNIYRLYLIMAEYKSLNILFPSNFNDNIEFDQYFEKL